MMIADISGGRSLNKMMGFFIDIAIIAISIWGFMMMFPLICLLFALGWLISQLPIGNFNLFMISAGKSLKNFNRNKKEL